MRQTIIILISILIYTTAFCQQDTVKIIDLSLRNILLKSSLIIEKKESGIFLTNIKPTWNSKRYKEQYDQLLAINKKTTFYPELILDNRYVSHAMPYRYGSQNYMWVSTMPVYKNIGEQITSDVMTGVIDGFLNSNKKQRFNNNKKGYYTPVGLKY